MANLKTLLYTFYADYCHMKFLLCGYTVYVPIKCILFHHQHHCSELMIIHSKSFILREVLIRSFLQPTPHGEPPPPPHPHSTAHSTNVFGVTPKLQIQKKPKLLPAVTGSEHQRSIKQRLTRCPKDLLPCRNWEQALKSQSEQTAA